MSAESKSAHAGKTLRCGGELTDDDGEPILNDHGVEATCDTTLTWEDHGQYVRSPPRDLGYESGALRFTCPDCGNVRHVCPVCSDHLKDDAENPHQAPGWFYGESTGEALACHNCNQQEAEAQRRDPFR